MTKLKSFRSHACILYEVANNKPNETPSHCSKSAFFVQKFNFDFPRKLPIFWGWKTRENVVVYDFLVVDNFDFTRKIVKKILGEKLVKMLGFCQNWISGQKLNFSNSVCHYKIKAKNCLIGLIHSREYQKNHSRESRKIYKSFLGIPGNGNEIFFSKEKSLFLYELQRFTLSFHVWSIVVATIKHLKRVIT